MLLTAVIFIAVVTGFGFIMYYVIAKPTIKFYDLADELEKDVRTIDDETGQVDRLFELSKSSWNRGTGEQMKLIASLMELKYKIELIKK